MMKEIDLVNGKGIALIDDSDYQLVNQYRWFFNNGYAITNSPPGISKGMSRMILQIKSGERVQVFHLNKNKLDNRRLNLEIRPMDACNNIVEPGIVCLENAQGFAMFDVPDTSLISKHKWYKHSNGYAVSENKIYMHRLIMKAQNEDSHHIDHIDGNGLNNRRCNLRLCSQSQNMMNQRKTRGTSKYKGVHIDKRTSKWIANIKVNRKTIYLGTYKNEDDAAHAYDQAARKHFGKFARTNFQK